jgi:hypothetical protein
MDKWQGVYHHIPIPNLKNIIFTIVSLQRGGSNWGIKIVQTTFQTTFQLIPLRVPRSVVRDALHELKPKK